MSDFDEKAITALYQRTNTYKSRIFQRDRHRYYCFILTYFGGPPPPFSRDWSTPCCQRERGLSLKSEPRFINEQTESKHNRLVSVSVSPEIASRIMERAWTLLHEWLIPCSFAFENGINWIDFNRSSKINCPAPRWCCRQSALDIFCFHICLEISKPCPQLQYHWPMVSSTSSWWWWWSSSSKLSSKGRPHLFCVFYYRTIKCIGVYTDNVR